MFERFIMVCSVAGCMVLFLAGAMVVSIATPTASELNQALRDEQPLSSGAKAASYIPTARQSSHDVSDQTPMPGHFSLAKAPSESRSNDDAQDVPHLADVLAPRIPTEERAWLRLLEDWDAKRSAFSPRIRTTDPLLEEARAALANGQWVLELYDTIKDLRNKLDKAISSAANRYKRSSAEVAKIGVGEDYAVLAEHFSDLAKPLEKRKRELTILSECEKLADTVASDIKWLKAYVDRSGHSGNPSQQMIQLVRKRAKNIALLDSKLREVVEKVLASAEADDVKKALAARRESPVPPAKPLSQYADVQLVSLDRRTIADNPYSLTLPSENQRLSALSTGLSPLSDGGMMTGAWESPVIISGQVCSQVLRFYPNGIFEQSFRQATPYGHRRAGTPGVGRYERSGNRLVFYWAGRVVERGNLSVNPFGESFTYRVTYNWDRSVIGRHLVFNSIGD